MQVRNVLRDLIVSIVLGTDMKQHVTTLSSCRSQLVAVPCSSSAGSDGPYAGPSTSRPSTTTSHLNRDRSSLRWNRRNSLTRYNSNTSNQLSSVASFDATQAFPATDNDIRPEMMFLGTQGSLGPASSNKSAANTMSGSQFSAGGRVTRFSTVGATSGPTSEGFRKPLPQLASLRLIDDEL